MQQIPLQAIPNQNFTTTLDSQLYDITLVTDSLDNVYATILLNGEKVISGQRCLAGRPLIPYAYLEGDGGNFTFATLGDLNPASENFNNTDILWYVSNAELLALRSA